MRGLDWQTVTFRLATGQNQKSGDFALDGPELAKCIDAQFDEVGQLQTRYPYAALGTDILGGGSLSDVRRVVPNGSELLCFTKTGLYSWNPTVSKWVLRGTHLAVKVDEQAKFVTAGEQYECDRAELSNTIIYAWRDGSSIYAAATNKTTGALIVDPAVVASGRKPRLVALSTKILFFYHVNGGGLEVRAIDPASPSAGLSSSGTVILSNAGTGGLAGSYDVLRIPLSDTAIGVCVRSPTSSYEAFKVTSALVVTNSTKVRPCDQAIAISCEPNGTVAQVIRTDINGAGPAVDIVGDRLTVSTLADEVTGQAVGTADRTVEQVAAAHRSVQNSSQYRCYAYWTNGQADSPGYEIKYNWVDTGGTISTQATFVKALGIASRAFDHEGSVYINLVFAGASVSPTARIALQNTYYLVRDDGFMCAKSASGRAGGFQVTAGHLPGVALTSGTTGYSWCGTERRVVPSGIGVTYADRGPRDVVYTFDSNDARRCARLGQTMYIACGEGLLQYDGKELTEVSFAYYPYYFTLAATTGNVEPGTYSVKSTFRSENAVGETDRSTAASVAQITLSSTGGIQVVSFGPLVLTHKSSIAVEYWRTLKDPTEDAPFYLTTGLDPSDTTGDNCFVLNDATSATLATWEDDLADSDAGDNASNPENGAVLENLAPPAATIVLATDVRLFLAGVAGDPDRVWYSKQRRDGEIAAFNDRLSVPVPREGGNITAIAVHRETLVVFREHAIYILPGFGYDNTGNGQNYGPAHQVPGNVGAVNQESIAVTDRGVVFKSDKGWYLLDNGWGLQYIGAPFSDYDTETPLAIHVIEKQHQIRILTSARMMVFDTLLEPWRGAEWTIADGLHACMWNGAHVYLASTGVKTQQTSYTSVDYGMDLEFAWLKFFDVQGYGVVDYLMILGEYRSACTVRVRLARDYWKDGASTYFQDKTHTPSLTAGKPLQLRHGPSIKSLQALKVRITVTQTAAGESVKWAALSFLVGAQGGLNRNLASTSKQ